MWMVLALPISKVYEIGRSPGWELPR